MENMWEKKWIEDIDYLKCNLIDKHINLFANITKEEFNNKIDNLKEMIKEIDYNETKVEISRVVASIKDAHTAIIFPVNKYLPLKFYCFEDGIYIINTTERYNHILFRKVISIEGTKIENVLDELSQIISFENEYLFKAKSMKYLQVAEVLYGLVIIDDMDTVRITLEDEEVVVVNTVNSKELIYKEIPLPLYERNSNENFWYNFIENKKEIYIKYNSCREIGEKSLKEKIVETITFINNNKINKVTIDLRHNLGGNSSLINPLIEYIKNNESINSKENLKVIIGRETFSSALLNAYEFKFYTNARIIGEPSGGKPNCYGEILKFTLPNSKFIVTYSTRYYKLIEDDNIMALYPDEFVFEQIVDYRDYLLTY